MSEQFTSEENQIQKKNYTSKEVEFIWQRKNFYKKLSWKLSTQNKLLEAKINTLSKNLKRKQIALKSCKQKEQDMKKWWIVVSCVIFLSTFILLGLTLIQISSKVFEQPNNFSPKVPTSGLTPITPNHVLASVIIFNGQTQGSGTIISQGNNHSLLLTAAHTVDKPDSSFWVYYPDGTYTEAKVIACDKQRDLALASVKSDTILSHSFVPEKTNPKNMDLIGVGYTQGQGPNVKDLKYNGAYYNKEKKYIWNLKVSSGPFWDGDSGGGIFEDGGLVGVTSQRDVNNAQSKQLYAISHIEILKFLKEHPLDKIEYGDYSIPATNSVRENSPPLWKPNPNVPIYTDSLSKPNFNELYEEINKIKSQLNGFTQEAKVPAAKEEPQKDYQLLRKPSDVPELENQERS
jgi:hypothetical protein